MNPTTPTKPKPTIDEKIAKLPEWAREHIENLDRIARNATHELKEFTDRQTVSPIFSEERITTELVKGKDGYRNRDDYKRVYLQGDQVTVLAHGILLRVATKYGSTNDNSITLQWSTPDRSCDDVCFSPTSFQMARLIARENMR